MSEQTAYPPAPGAEHPNTNPSYTNDIPADISMTDAPAANHTSQTPLQSQPQSQQSAPSPIPIPHPPTARIPTPTPTPSDQNQQQQQQQQRPTSRAPSAHPESAAGATATGAGFTMPSEAAAHGAPVRQYINSKITGTLLEGMKIVAREQPKDPLRVLGEFLLQRSRELEGRDSSS